MFDNVALAELDVAALCGQIEANQAALREQEWRELVIAAQWAVLHGPESMPPTGPGSRAGSGGRPGGERLRRAGGQGTPQIAEFACAELGMLMGRGFISASALIRDAVDLQHRHPRLWAALAAGGGRVWKARQVARMTTAAGLDLHQALFVDAATTDYIDTLTWSAFTRLVEARIIEADPEAAEARRQAAALERFVSTGRSNEHGLKTLVAKATAGEVIYFVAMCDRIAQILLLEGDTDPVDVRRSKAIAILANPATALALLERYACDQPHPQDPNPDPDEPDDEPDREPDRQPRSASEDACAAPAEPDDDPDDGGRAGAAAHLCRGCGGPRLDPDKLRPTAVLYLRISEQTLRTRRGVVHAENGIGPLPIQALTDLLGHHRVTVRPVLDYAGQVPIDAYEIPHDMREALRLARPTSVFPWTRSGTNSPSTGGSRGVQLDHTRPYVPMARGGPPGQTRPANLGPLVTFGHRLKTHARGWRHRQPQPGVYLWRTPHGYWYQTDNDGTHPLGRDPDLTDLP